MNETARASKAVSWAISGAAYAAALIAAALVVALVDPGHPLVAIGLGTLVATVVVFVASMAVDNSSIYDPYWSLQPLAIAVYYLASDRDGIDARQGLVAVLVFFYALRLTSNFYRDWPGLSKEDFRYRAFRANAGRAYWPVSFAGIHLFPTIMVYLGCLPLYAVTRPEAAGLSWLDGVATVVLAGAIVLAFVADEQLRVFRRDPRNKGLCMGSGLWAYSRHPNYLGEVATWWGLWLFALAAGLSWWWTVVGALAITLLFVFVSVPMMEKRASATREGYPDYQERTPMLVPSLRRATLVDPDGPGT